MDEEKDKGGRPRLEPNERTVPLGAILVGEGLKVWLAAEASKRGRSQGHVVRMALLREKRITEAKERSET